MEPSPFQYWLLFASQVCAGDEIRASDGIGSANWRIGGPLLSFCAACDARCAAAARLSTRSTNLNFAELLTGDNRSLHKNAAGGTHTNQHRPTPLRALS